ncbi:unnamed protein product, partial [Nesidiocoris tenuis]
MKGNGAGAGLEKTAGSGRSTHPSKLIHNLHSGFELVGRPIGFSFSGLISDHGSGIRA